MFKANEVSGGGSFYLQSKIFRAKERLLADMGSPNTAAADATATASASATNATKAGAGSV